MNPLNTSTDSLYVTEGNPYLLPELSNQATFSFAWNGKAVYLQPSVTYRYVQKCVQSVGFLVGDVYTQISHTSSAAMTDATFGWNLLKGWSVTFSLRDNMACSRQWTRDGATALM